MLSGGEAGVVLPEGGLDMLPEELDMLPELSDGLVAELEAGGDEAGAELMEELCFAQAVNISATASALRATFVFIDRYPNGLREAKTEKAL